MYPPRHIAKEETDFNHNNYDDKAYLRTSETTMSLAPVESHRHQG